MLLAYLYTAKQWPVVFIPAVEGGVFPFYRSENDDEERYRALPSIYFIILMFTTPVDYSMWLAQEPKACYISLFLQDVQWGASSRVVTFHSLSR